MSIRIETNADPKHWFYHFRLDEHSLFRYRNCLFCALLKTLFLVIFTQLLSCLSHSEHEHFFPQSKMLSL
jgi:hypothetical protein